MPRFGAVLLVPVVTIGLLTWLRLDDEIASVTALSTIHEEQQLADQAEDVATALQAERDAIVGYIAGGRTTSDLNQINRSRQVDAAADTFKAAIAAADDLSPTVSAAATAAVADLDALTALRATSTATHYPDSATFLRYSAMIEDLTAVSQAMAAGISTPALAPLAETLAAAVDDQEQTAEQSAILISAARHGGFPPGQNDALRAAQARQGADQTSFGQTATADERQNFQNIVAGPAVDQVSQLSQEALLDDGAGKRVAIDTAAAAQAGEAKTGLVRQVVQALDQELDQAITQLTEATTSAAWRDGAGVIGFVLLALAIMLLVARSLLKPLQVLRDSALDVAYDHLPQAVDEILAHVNPTAAIDDAVRPVPLDTDEEVGQVARAFDVVQREAMRLAAEQAVLRGNVNAMFVNLSRRSQNLLERQLELIDKQEQSETDPDQLANLFELDHLATRMRRNSENLLVLAGTQPNRRITRPVPIEEIFGAASSEIEQYPRVKVVAPPQVAIDSRMVHDLIHLMAELLENATEFSDPTTSVTVRAVTTRNGKLRVEIHDRGVGMDDQALAHANGRLAEPPQLDLGAAKHMGLHVVGRLAQRHEIQVTLRANLDIDGGVTAQIMVPAEALRPAAEVSLVASLRRVVEAQVPHGLFTPAADPVPVPAPRDAETTLAQGVGLQVPVVWPTVDDAAPSTAPPEEPAEATTRLPIYENVLSIWFRDDADLLGGGEKVLVQKENDLSQQSIVDQSDVRQADEPDPAGPPEAVAGWASPADTEWQAAAEVAASTALEPDTTVAGLPKRSPGTRLLAGSAAAPSSAAPTAPPSRRRDTTGLAGFARGVQRGRHALTNPAPESPGSERD